MIPTDSAALRAKTLLARATRNGKPMRIFIGFYSVNGQHQLTAVAELGHIRKSLPYREMEVAPNGDQQLLEQNLEDAWAGLRRELEMAGEIKPAKLVTIPDRRHGWRLGVMVPTRPGRRKVG